MRPYRCLKCAEFHSTKNCPKVDCATPATCALCLGPHPSNYKGCEVYKEILARKSQKRSFLGTKRFESQLHTNTMPISQQTNSDQTAILANHNSKTLVKYNQVVKRQPVDNIANQQSKEETHQPLSYNRIEEIFIKQSEKIDIILQQMSNMLGLLTTLVNKLTQC